jgi:hypothetical protein
MSSLLLDPRVLDASNLTPKATSDIYLPIAVEGQADSAGAAVIGTPALYTRIDQVNDAFGPASRLAAIVSAVLSSGAGPVIAIASAKGTLPTLIQRQAAWEKLESNEGVRLRLTDSEVQADLVALAQSAANADLLYNKQIAVGGLATATTKANLITAANAIAGGATQVVTQATRFVLVAPGVYDAQGALRGGSYAAAVVAAEIAKNSNPTNDLDLWVLPPLNGIEVDSFGLPIFRRKVVSGTAMDDFEDLLQGGVSPLQPSRVPGGVATTHLRTVYTTNGAYDSLYTRVIVDQVFVDVKNYIYDGNFLRAPNSERTREQLRSGVAAVLAERGEWIQPVTQPDGTRGYNVSVTSSTDNRQVTVGYEGIVRRGISTIKVAANLTIPI